MSTGQGSDAEPLTMDIRPLRDVGGAIGSSFDIEALRELGLANEDGELAHEELRAKQTIYEDGRIVLEPLDGEN